MPSVHLAIHSWYPFSKVQEVQSRLAQIAEEKGTTTAIKSTLSFSSATEKGFYAIAYHEIEEGNLEEGLYSMGQVVGRIRDIPTVAELVQRIIEEAKAVKERLDQLM